MAVLTLRIPAELHKLVRVAAAERQASVQAWLVEAIRIALDDQASRPGFVATRAAMEGEP